jgi:ribosomal protein S27AE
VTRGNTVTPYDVNRGGEDTTKLDAFWSVLESGETRRAAHVAYTIQTEPLYRNEQKRCPRCSILVAKYEDRGE